MGLITLQKHLSSPADGLYPLTDGKSTHLESAPKRIIDLLKNARQAMWLISVSDQVQRAGKRERFHRSDGQLIPVREDRRFSREEITTVVVGPVSCANDGDDDEDEDWEDEEEEPLWSAPDGHEGDGRSPPRRSEI